MTPFAARTTLLFGLAATIPVAMILIVWFVVVGFGRESTTAEASLVRRSFERLETRRSEALQSACRDDLVVDQLLAERAGTVEGQLDYDRLFRASIAASGFDALWALDPGNGEIVARGHRPPLLAEGSELSRRAREAGSSTFLFDPGIGGDGRLLLQACAIEREGTGLYVVGGHRLSTLRSLDSEQIFVTDAVREDDRVLAELLDSRGSQAGMLVWRSKVDRRGPPLLLWLAAALALALGLALLFGGYLSRWLQASADQLADAATRVGRGDFDTTLRDDAGAAFPATATAFNRMTRDLRDARAELRQTARAAAWQDIAKSLAHELKNPLSPIRLSIETLRKAHARSRDDFDALFDASTRTILEEVERLRRIIDEFSRFARLPAPRRRATDLRATIEQASMLHREGPVALDVRLPEDEVRIAIDPEQIIQVLHNLLQNAIDAASSAHPSGGGQVLVSLEKTAGRVYVHVEDNGEGIPATEAEAVFDPYYSRKEGGTGLGLAISERIMREHGGQIRVKSVPGHTRFSLEFVTGPSSSSP
jgi:signal transduction histidine kinase